MTKSFDRVLQRPEIAVIGAGNFGTALADMFAYQGYQVPLWVYEPDLAETMARTRENVRYVPGFKIHDNVHPTSDMEEVVADKSLILVVSPAQVTRNVMQLAAPFLDPQAVVVCCAKGIEITTSKLMSEVMDEVLPEPNRASAAYLSGPSFAREIMKRLPTVVTVAAQDEEIAEFVQHVVACDFLRVYSSTDVVGVEVAGAVKNVMAIAAGIGDGLGFGHNARAALITRGLAEITRLGLAMGAQPATFAGLAGVGDLVLTCTGDLSRNRTVGLKLGAGMALDDIVAGMGQVAEGIGTTKAVYNLSRTLDVYMPIVEEMYHILYEGKPPRQAVIDVMAHPLRREDA